MYLTPQEAKEKFDYHPKSLARWADQGLINFVKSPGGHRRYLLSSLENFYYQEEDKREIILYIRVSTNSQKEDLESQRQYVSSYYPQCKCVSDLGSGLNFKRKKFISIMQQVADGKIKKIVIAQKDRLCRFGFDFVEWFCKLNNCEIEILNSHYQTPYEELMEDFMAIMHCFSSRLYFLRSYKKKIKQEVDNFKKSE